MKKRITASASDWQALLGANAEGLPVVALVGRANAGKSTLFNRVVRRSRAIVSAIPGTTRDLNIFSAEHDGRRFLLIDSGGLDRPDAEVLNEKVTQEALRAVGYADVVVFIIDGRAGLSAADHETIGIVRSLDRPLLVAINKLDQSNLDDRSGEFYALGADRLFPISASHGRGVEDLLDAIVAQLPEKQFPQKEDAASPSSDLAQSTPFEGEPEGDLSGPPSSPRAATLRIAIIGRPNVGKSSLLNRLAGYQRSIVDETPGTTRDPVDIRLRVADRELVLIDTAGIRRPTRVEGELEESSVGRAIGTIRRAEVLALVIDATEGITDQDARLARLVDHEDRGLVVVCNKWDEAARLGRKISAFKRDVADRYSFLKFAPLVFTSALTGDGVRDLLPALQRVGANFRTTFQTAKLNRVLSQASAAIDPPVVAGRRLNLLYVTQLSSSPPRLAFFSNIERDIPIHYVRFLEGKFRDAFDLAGTPLRLEFRKRAPHRPRSDASEPEKAKRAARH
jgi:GTP-binding protein